MAERAVLAIDEGTTNAKAILVSETGEIISGGSCAVAIEHPRSGWVQQDADEIWAATLKAIQACVEAAPDTKIVALGISNQRESILLWDGKTGRPLGPVLTWQCRRTSAECETLRQAGHEATVIERTGLPIDPLFPPTKAAWLLKHFGTSATDLRIGTVDSWLIWKLTNGKVHASDRSNAARTQLFNLKEERWDETLCELFGVPMELLPDVHDSAHVFGTTEAAGVLPDGVPVASAIGDSHAALFGHGAHGVGDGKITFGTGSSVMTTLPSFIEPPSGITTTIAWSLNGRSTYAFEGNILVSASIFPWAADLLGLESVDALLDLARTVDDSNGVVLVPAHVGLGSPHWNPDARGLISGLSFGAKPAHLCRAAAESMAFQVQDVFEIMTSAAGGLGRLYVDGGPSRNRPLMQLVADYLGHTVAPCKNSEASALGAAHLCGLATGFWPDIATVAALCEHEPAIVPSMPEETRTNGLAAWRKAVARTIIDV